MKIARLLSVSLAVLLVAVALAQTAGLVIQNAPEQEIEADGQTVLLPKGGTIRDNKNGLVIEAKFVRFKNGDFLEAKTATLRNTAGQAITTPALDYRIKQDRMVLAGPLSYSSKEVSGLSASKAVVFPQAGKVVALGGVRAQSPQFSADAVVLDGKAKEALLYGNYAYPKQGLKGNGGKATLLVNFSKSLENPSVTTKVDAKKLEAFVALIEQSK